MNVGGPEEIVLASDRTIRWYNKDGILQGEAPWSLNLLGLAFGDVNGGGLNEIVPLVCDVSTSRQCLSLQVEIHAREGSITVDHTLIEYYPIEAPSHDLGGQLDCSLDDNILCNYFVDSESESVGWIIEARECGIHHLEFSARTGFGPRDSFVHELKVDLCDPTAASTVSGGTPGTNDWFVSSVSIRLSGSDLGSGLSAFEYNLDNDPGVTVPPAELICIPNSVPLICTLRPASVQVTDEGIHSLSLAAVDKAGRRSVTQTMTVMIDATPPEVSGSLDRPADHNGWYNAPVTVTWSGTDATSGVASCTAPSTYSGPDGKSLPGSGVVGQCIDNAGNHGDLVPISYDATPPETAIVSVTDGNGAFLENGGVTLFPPATLTFTASDATSGVEGFECSIDDSAFTTCSNPFLGGTDIGTHRFQVRALDVAGNVDQTAAEFTWSVITSAEAVSLLSDNVTAMDLATKVNGGLLGLLTQLSELLSDGSASNDISGCYRLDAFTSLVNSQEARGGLDATQAEQLRTLAANIRLSLSCATT